MTPQSSQSAGQTPSARSRPGRSDSIGYIPDASDMQEPPSARFIQPPTAKTVPTVVETLLDASPLSHRSEPAGTAYKQPASSSPTSTSFKTAPIMAQPSYSAMSMVVPGINAKNRNEVMSIGFSPPVVAPPAPPKEEGGIGTKLQGIGNIGNIYRLLNRNNTEGSDSKNTTGATNAVPSQQSEDHAQYATVDESDIRRTIGNPPTPPRTSSDVVKGGDSPRRSMDAGSSPASAALLSLVQRDELARRKSLSRRRTGSSGDQGRQRSDSSSSSPLAAGFVVPVTSTQIESQPAS
jgi:hypothetical protein